MAYLIDTNVISELKKRQPEPSVVEWFSDVPQASLYISVLTIGEVRYGLSKLKNHHVQEQFTGWLEKELLPAFEKRILPIDQMVAENWGRIRSSAHRTMPSINALIAATALQHHLTIVTRNAKDFEFPGVKVVNPWPI